LLPVNAFILITCLSAINSSIYIASRALLFLAADGKAPHIFKRVNKRGVPVNAIILANACGAISMMNNSTGAAEAYSYLINVSSVCTFLVWGSISFTHIRFRQAWKAQGRTVEELPFKSFAYPYNAYFGVIANVFLALIQGWSVFAPFDAGAFVAAYIMIPVFLLIAGAWMLARRSPWRKLDDVDLDYGRRKDLDIEDDESRTRVQRTGIKSKAKGLWANL
jgi:amino acid transporter